MNLTKNSPHVFVKNLGIRGKRKWRVYWHFSTFLCHSNLYATTENYLFFSPVIANIFQTVYFLVLNSFLKTEISYVYKIKKMTEYNMYTNLQKFLVLLFSSKWLSKYKFWWKSSHPTVQPGWPYTLLHFNTFSLALGTVS